MYRTHELVSEHTCLKFNRIVHALCGVFHHHLEVYVCHPCINKEVSPLSLIPPLDPLVNPPLAPPAIPPLAPPIIPPSRIIKRCGSCGGTDHTRKSSAQCPYYRKNPPLLL